jgi:hypothetical protein
MIYHTLEKSASAFRTSIAMLSYWGYAKPIVGYRFSYRQTQAPAVAAARSSRARCLTSAEGWMCWNPSWTVPATYTTCVRRASPQRSSEVPIAVHKPPSLQHDHARLLQSDSQFSTKTLTIALNRTLSGHHSETTLLHTHHDLGSKMVGNITMIDSASGLLL